MKFWLKTAAFGLCAGVALAGLSLPQKALAAGETFSWSGANIVGSGGDFNTPAFEPKTVTFTGTSNTYTGKQNYMSGSAVLCAINYSIKVDITDSSKGTLTVSSDCPGQSTPVTAAITINGTRTGTSTGTTAEDDLCDRLGPNPLNFFVCPVINIVADAAQRLDCTVLNILIIDTGPIFGGTQGTQDSDPNTGQCLLSDSGASTDTPEETAQKTGNAVSSDAFRKAWGVFRNISYALLLIFGLIMVISQIMGLEIFDAYTIKKMLPKLIIAVIFISLSWNIMNFLFNLSNDAAFAVMELIKAPFKGIDAGIGTGVTDLSLVTLIPVILGTAAVAGAGVLFILGPGGILALMASIFLAIFSAFILLAARNVAAYLIIIAAPLAIICYAFEPFKKLFTLWKTLLITILLSIPAVAAVIEISHVGALVAYISNTGISTLTAVALLIAGYAMIWGIFKKIDAVAGQLGNIVSGVTGKLQKGLSDYRSKQFKQRSQIFKEGGLLSEKTALGRSLNTFGRKLGAAQAINANAGKGGYSRAFGRDSAYVLSTYDDVIRRQREKDPWLQAASDNDYANAVLAGSGGVNTDAALAESAAAAGLTGQAALDAIAGARAIGVNRTNAMTALRTMTQNKARGVSHGNVRFMDHAVRKLARSRQEYEGLAYEAAFFARSNGRTDLGGTDWVSWDQSGTDASGNVDPKTVWGAARQLVAQEQASRTNNGTPALSQDEQNNIMWQYVADRTILDGISRTGVQAVVAGHDYGARQAVEALSRMLRTTAPAGAPPELVEQIDSQRLRAAIELKELQGNLPAGTSGSVRDVINNVLFGAKDAKVVLPDGTTTTAATGSLGLDPNKAVATQLADIYLQNLQMRNATTGALEPRTITPEALTTMGRTYAEYDPSAARKNPQAGP